MRRQLVRHDRTTAIVITQNCRFDLFAQSLLSLLLRTANYDYLDGVIVIVNGGRFDPAGDLLDRKLAFLQDLTLLDYRGRPVPLGIVRVWGIGGGLTHSPCLDAAMSFITTEHFLSMHDDVIVKDPTWADHVRNAFAVPEVAMVACPHLLMCRLQETHPPGNDARRVLLVPHPNTCFLSCRTAPFFELGCRWLGYCADLPIPLGIDALEPDMPAMLRFYDDTIGGSFTGASGVEDKVLDISKPFVVVGHDVGAWYLNSLWRNRYVGAEVSPQLVSHIVSASWHSAEDVDRKLKEEFKQDIEDIDKEIRASPVFGPIYIKHMTINGH